MLTSIIIPVYNQWHYTKKCIESIINNTSRTYEIIVIDNGSTDYTKSGLKKYNEINIITNEKNLGYAKACNQGARKAKGDLLLFLNNDTIVTKDWVDKMVKCISSKPDIGVVGCKLLFPETNKIQHAGVVLYNKIPGHIFYNEPGSIPQANIKKYYPAVTGACLLTLKNLYNDVNGFDENYVNGYEDVDYCLKAWETGYKVLYCPDTLIYHYGSVSENRHLLEKENLQYFIQKWKNKLDNNKINFLEQK